MSYSPDVRDRINPFGNSVPYQEKKTPTGSILSFQWEGHHHFVAPFSSIAFQVCFTKVKHGDSSLYIDPIGILMLFNVLSLTCIFNRNNSTAVSISTPGSIQVTGLTFSIFCFILYSLFDSVLFIQ